MILHYHLICKLDALYCPLVLCVIVVLAKRKSNEIMLLINSRIVSWY